MTTPLSGIAAAIPIANLDTDQIMPKQFLHGIDKSGLARGLLWDLRFDAEGRPRPDFVLNRPGWTAASVLVGGPNFGCGSSREHAVWGLQQFGIRAVIAPSYGEIFAFNALNNGLPLIALPEAQVQALIAEAEAGVPLRVEIDLEAQRVGTPGRTFAFTMPARQRRLLLQGLDMLGATLERRPAIDAFARRHWQAYPWLQDVARRTRARLDDAR